MNDQEMRSQGEEMLSVVDIARLTGLPLNRVRNIGRIYVNKIPSTIRNGQRYYPKDALELFDHYATKSGQTNNNGVAQEPGNSHPELNSNGDLPVTETPKEASPTLMEDDVYLSIEAIAQQTKIPEESLRKYRNRYSSKIPTEGTGKNRFHPKTAVPIFVRIHKEVSSGRKPDLAKITAATQNETLYTIKQIAEILNVAPHVLYFRYKQHAEEIPTVGEGRSRKYPPPAIDVFKRLISQPRARRSGSGTVTKPRRTAANAAVMEKLEELDRKQEEILEMLRGVLGATRES